MRFTRTLAVSFALISATSVMAQTVPCGGDFNTFKSDMEAEAVLNGFDAGAAAQFFAGVRRDPATIKADRRQGVFQLPFVDFSRRLISAGRINNGKANGQKWDSVFSNIEATYGINRGVLLAFWAFETDYGAIQGDFNTVNSLVTLAHDCRRPELFRPQVFSALELFERGDLDPARTTGAWAGEIGMVQMLPGDILENGIDADGDGVVSLKTSAPDALTSGAAMLSDLGWRPDEPWIQEVVVPSDLDWSLTGLDTTKTPEEWASLGVRARDGDFAAGSLPTSIILPQGRNGPAFLAYPNFGVYFEWNQSFVYVLTAAYFATRLEGAQVYDAGNPTPPLSDNEMKALQQRLTDLGYDVGDIDGILGAGTRNAVQKVQQELGLPADAWPTRELLQRL